MLEKKKKALVYPCQNQQNIIAEIKACNSKQDKSGNCPLEQYNTVFSTEIH